MKQLNLNQGRKLRYVSILPSVTQNNFYCVTYLLLHWRKKFHKLSIRSELW